MLDEHILQAWLRHLTNTATTLIMLLSPYQMLEVVMIQISTSYIKPVWASCSRSFHSCYIFVWSQWVGAFYASRVC